MLDRIVIYPGTLKFLEGAAKGRVVGTVDYGLSPVTCGGDLRALEADGADYAVTEALTYGTDICRNGEIRLRLDTDETELEYKWYTLQGELHATATLTRQE